MTTKKKMTKKQEQAWKEFEEKVCKVASRGMDISFKLGYTAGNAKAKGFIKRMSIWMWVCVGISAFNCVVTHHMCHKYNDLQYRVKDYLFTEYMDDREDFTDLANAFGFEEDILDLDFQRVRYMIESGRRWEDAKKEVF